MNKIYTINANEQDSSRIQVAIAGLGYVNINRTHEGVIIDVHNELDEDSIDSIALMEDDFQCARFVLLTPRGVWSTEGEWVKDLGSPLTFGSSGNDIDYQSFILERSGFNGNEVMITAPLSSVSLVDIADLSEFIARNVFEQMLYRAIQDFINKNTSLDVRYSPLCEWEVVGKDPVEDLVMKKLLVEQLIATPDPARLAEIVSEVSESYALYDEDSLFLFYNASA